MSKTFDDFCRRKGCEKPYAVNCEPITMADGTQKFIYEIEYHKSPIKCSAVSSGGDRGIEDTEEQALWHLHDWMFRNLIGSGSVEFFISNKTIKQLVQGDIDK